MTEVVEKIIDYALGCVIGFITGYFLLYLNISFFNTDHTSIIFVTSPLVGLLGAIAVTEYKKERAYKENNKVRDEAVALITHEMRTGLTSTGWSIELMLQKYKDVLSAEDKEMLKNMVKSIQTTVMHSVNLLDITLLDIGKLSISLEWSDLKTVEKMLHETIEKYILGANRRGIKLTYDIHLNFTKQIQVDMLRLRIVLENLLENSLQYTPKGKEISVHITSTAEFLNMVVSDQGIGIPILEQEKIFSEFYRASNARKTLSNGSGIGLYLCKKYVTAHHGTIRFESKQNQGTTFYISIPLKTNADVEGFFKKM